MTLDFNDLEDRSHLSRYQTQLDRIRYQKKETQQIESAVEDAIKNIENNNDSFVITNHSFQYILD